jgi:endonuclease YncB( thermonuclease family)
VAALTNSASVTGRADYLTKFSLYSSKGAPGSVAPFTFWLLLLAAVLASLCSRQAVAAVCPAEHSGERVQVVYVYDGDTVKLQDGRRVRLIGINTPELGRGDRPVQPFATQARSLLQNLLNENNRTLLLQYGKEHQDRYGRILAHAFLASGTNVAVRLLQQGLATTLVVPPNTWGERCYQGIENDARSNRRGIWTLEKYQAQDARSLAPDAHGFHIIHGRVSTVHQTRKNTWVNIEDSLAVQISARDRSNFQQVNLESLTGRTVELRGWLKPTPEGHRLKVQHPAAIVIITGKPGN